MKKGQHRIKGDLQLGNRVTPLAETRRNRLLERSEMISWLTPAPHSVQISRRQLDRVLASGRELRTRDTKFEVNSIY